VNSGPTWGMPVTGVSDALSSFVVVVRGVAPKMFRRNVDRLNDVIEQRTGERRDPSVGQDEVLRQSRHRGEVATGQLVEQRDAIRVLVAKIGNPHPTRGGLGVELRQQPIDVSDHVHWRLGNQATDRVVEHRGLVWRQESVNNGHLAPGHRCQWAARAGSLVAGHVLSMTLLWG
jgi:hypothetical protein